MDGKGFVMPESQVLDAIALLKQDHRTVEDLFAQFEKASGDGRKQTIAEQICLELSVHAKIEEEIFYPACRKAGVDSDTMDEANVEHDGAKSLIAELENGAPGDDFYDAKVKVLSEEIKHHVREEEKPGGVFSQARENDMDLKALGEKMAARKKELMTAFEDNGLPPPMTVTMKAPPLEQQAGRA